MLEADLRRITDDTEVQRRAGFPLSNDFESTIDWANPYIGEYKNTVLWEGRKPISFYELMDRYAQYVLEKGKKRATIVDFGAGAGVTICIAGSSGLLYNLVQEGKAQLIATNLKSVPGKDTYYGGTALLWPLKPDRAEYISNAVDNDLVDFKAFDMAELRDYLGEERVDLMIMARTVGFTPKINDALLRVASSLLDPKYGTLALGPMNIPGNEIVLFYEGADDLRNSSWEQRPPGFISLPDSHTTSFVLFQAPEAPNFEILPYER